MPAKRLKGSLKKINDRKAGAHKHALKSVVRPPFKPDETPCPAPINRPADSSLALLNNFPALIWRSDIHAKCDFFNQAWLEFTGRTLEQEMGDGWTAGVHPEDLPDCLKNFLQAFHARQPFALEYRLRRHDGEYRRILDQGRAFHGPHGKFAGYIGSGFDITDARRTEQTLRESEEKFRQLADNITDVFWMTSPDLKTALYVSAGYELLWGRSPESLYAHPSQWFEAILPGQRDRVLALVGLLRENEPMTSIEYQIARPDGAIRWVHDRGFQVRDAAGHLIRLAGIATDITERKQTEQSLNLFRTLIDQSNDGFEVIDPETGRFLDVNGTTCERLGYTREELLRLSVPDIETVAVDFSSWDKNVKEIRQSHRKIIEGRHRRKDGSTFPVEVSVRYVKLDRDYLVASVRDLTERRKAQKKLSHREYQVLRLTSSGKTLKEIAEALGISIQTVSTHRARILKKMGLHNSAELIRYALENELFD